MRPTSACVAGTVIGLAVLHVPSSVAAVATLSRADARVEARPAMHSGRKVAECLQHRDVMAGNLPVRVSKYPAAYPPGVLGAVQFFTGFGPKIDGGELFFFKSSALAKNGEAKLVSVFLYGRGLPTILKAAVKSQGGVAPGTARSLYRRSGNVVLIWNHPRRRVAASNTLVNSCLISSREP